jgi:hypothetical protein
MPLRMLLLMDPRRTKLMLFYNMSVGACLRFVHRTCSWLIPAGTKVGTHTYRGQRNLQFAPGARMDATEDDD